MSVCVCPEPGECGARMNDHERSDRGNVLPFRNCPLGKVLLVVALLPLLAVACWGVFAAHYLVTGTVPEQACLLSGASAAGHAVRTYPA